MYVYQILGPPVPGSSLKVSYDPNTTRAVSYVAISL